MKNKLMTHVVAGYPTEALCIELMLSMQTVGVYAIEVQIPFSDPSADGPTIMEANDVALQNGMTTVACFKLIQKARANGLEVPIYIMSYANKLLSFGFDNFCKETSKCNIQGLIIPDLPCSVPEYKELAQYCSKYGIDMVPVLSPGVAPDRLKQYKLTSNKLVYVTSSKGITGKQIAIRPDLIKLIKTLRSKSDCQIALGFGIRAPEDVRRALSIADIAVVGSEVIRKVNQQDVSGAVQFINKLVNPRETKT